MTTDTPATLQISRRYRASPERVFDAWLDPELIARWMLGAGTIEQEIIHIKVDARVGGSFSFLVRRGEHEVDHVGTYRELDRPHRLAFTWGVVGDSEDESVVTLDFAPVEGGCELTLTHEMEPQWADYADRTRMGWETMMDSLERLLA